MRRVVDDGVDPWLGATARERLHRQRIGVAGVGENA
jgi:hypothetical protein